MLQLYLCHDFYNLIFKTEHKLCITSGPVLPSSNENFWVHTCSLLIQYRFPKVLVTYYDYPKPSVNYAAFYV